jgi:hypothetical protein
MKSNFDRMMKKSFGRTFSYLRRESPLQNQGVRGDSLQAPGCRQGEKTTSHTPVKITVVASLFLAALIAAAGCDTKIAPVGIYPTGGNDVTLLANFDAGTAAINPFLYEVGKVPPHITSPEPGGVQFRSFPVPVTVGLTPVTVNGVVYNSGAIMPTDDTCCATVEAGGANGSPYALHVTSWLDDPESALYPPGPGNFDSVFIRAWPNFNNPYTFNASFFTGVQFYLKVSSKDTAPVKLFQVPIDQTHGFPEGKCYNMVPPANPNSPFTHCWDHFGYDYSSVPRDRWLLIKKDFADLHQQGYGSPAIPPSLTDHLDKIMYLMWVEGNAAQAGFFTVDFYVDDIRFY